MIWCSRLFSYFVVFCFTGVRTSPRDIAEKIMSFVPTVALIEKMEVAGAGFINITISRGEGLQMLQTILSNGVLPPNLSKKLKVVVDFSSPNIAKEMHVGHLRYFYI